MNVPGQRIWCDADRCNAHEFQPEPDADQARANLRTLGWTRVEPAGRKTAGGYPDEGDRCPAHKEAK